MAILDIHPVAVLTQAIAFIILVLFVAKFVFPFIRNSIDTRRQEIVDTLEQIAADRHAMEATRADYERRLAGIEAEARERITGAVKQAQEEAAAILAAARQDAVHQRERALADIDQERKKAVAEIRAQMADMAVIAAGKILEREINPAVHRELINDFISDVGPPPA
jgi:F-type H+-transporting ATPase subunit b